MWEIDARFCTFRIDPSGIFFLGRVFSGKLQVSPEGNLVGMTEFDSMDEQVPTLVRLLD